MGADLHEVGERNKRKKSSPMGRGRALAIVALVTAIAGGVAFWVAWNGSLIPPASLAPPSSRLRAPDLRASSSTATLYLLPVPEGSRLIDQRNVMSVEEVVPGKIQKSFEEDALESYEVDAHQDAIASFFHYHLERQGWAQELPADAGDAALTLMYSMEQYSWAVRIKIEGGEPSDLARFHVRGRKL